MQKETRNSFLSIFLLLVSLLPGNQAIGEETSNTVTVDDVEQIGSYKLRLRVETIASKETIWRLWEDVDNWKQYDEILVYSMLDEGQKFEVGATGAVKAKGSPRSKFELTEVTTGVSFTERLTTPLWQSIYLLRYFEEDSAPEQDTVATEESEATENTEAEPESEKTVFVHEVHFKGSLKWLIYAVAGNTFRTELPRVMNNLKRVAEAKSAAEANQE